MGDGHRGGQGEERLAGGRDLCLWLWSASFNFCVHEEVFAAIHMHPLPLPCCVMPGEMVASDLSDWIAHFLHVLPLTTLSGA